MKIKDKKVADISNVIGLRIYRFYLTSPGNETGPQKFPRGERKEYFILKNLDTPDEKDRCRV